jgi:hypothetical protein
VPKLTIRNTYQRFGGENHLKQGKRALTALIELEVVRLRQEPKATVLGGDNNAIEQLFPIIDR